MSQAADFDRRVTPARPDLAAAHLRGVVEAPRYAEGRRMRVVDAVAPLRRAPAPDAPLDTEALHGETVTVYDIDDEGWAWGQLDHDGYVGWLPAGALIDAAGEPTHRVATMRTFLYPGPSIKLPPFCAMSIGSRVEVLRRQGEFAVTPQGAIFAGHLAPLGMTEPDFVAVAERFEDVPYLWGGRSSLGLDCSGLVQVALGMAGTAAPRDSDMQERGLGHPLPPDAPLQRGDLVFWKGHVGIMRDAAVLLHANGHHMLVRSEPLDVAVERILSKGGGPITGLRRLTPGS